MFHLDGWQLYRVIVCSFGIGAWMTLLAGMIGRSSRRRRS